MRGWLLKRGIGKAEMSLRRTGWKEEEGLRSWCLFFATKLDFSLPLPLCGAGNSTFVRGAAK